MEGNVTLILNEKRIEVDKQKLARKSNYFLALFSHNFNDSHDKEHVINYNIAFSTLQNFIEWVHDDQVPTCMQYGFIKASLIKFVKDNFTELLNILQLSILFTVDELTNNATDIIISYWLLPEKVIDIWLLAQELCLKQLQDVCLSVCLDIFEELPVSSLTELTKDNITLLLKNVNVRSSIEYLKFIRNEWLKCHQTSDIIEIRDKRELKFIHGAVVYDTSESAIRNAFLYTWNGNELSKCIQLKKLWDCGNLAVGMQVVSRGFSIYIVGGEQRLGTGKFNDIIWRYCLLSKKWYYQAHLCIPRRHMIAVFLKDKLVVAGGVGRHRTKLETVDILQIHSGTWKECASIIPESFTEIPIHCVFDGKLFFLKTCIYIYSIETNVWQTIPIENPTRQSVGFLTPDRTLFWIEKWLEVSFLAKAEVKNSVCMKEDCFKWCVQHRVLNFMDIVPEPNHDLYRIRRIHLDSDDVITLNTDRDEEYQYLDIHFQVIKESLVIPRWGSIKTIDPDTLYDTV